MARPPTQTTTGLMIDRRAFDIALQRLSANTTLPKAQKQKAIDALCLLIKQYVDWTLNDQRGVRAMAKTG